MKVHGSCHCGSVRYEAEIDPARVTICHCTDCQALTGSAYRVSVPVSKDDFVLQAGTPTIYVKTAESGARRAQAFCGNCGSVGIRGARGLHRMTPAAGAGEAGVVSIGIALSMNIEALPRHEEERGA